MVTSKNQSSWPRQYNKPYLWQIAFALIGIALSLYLFIHHTRLESGIQDSASFCSLGGYVDCDVVNVSRYSELFGVPIAMIGAIYFFVLLLASLLAPPKDKGFALMQRLMAWLTALATLYNLVLFFVVQVFILKTFCLMCFFTYLCTAGHLFFNLKMTSKEERHWKGKLRASFLDKIPFNLKLIPPARWAFAGISFTTFVALTAFLPSFIRQKSSTYSFVDGTIEQFYLQWKDKPIKRIEVKPTDGTFGNPNSKIQIVEFSDFECPFCRKSAFTLHTALAPLEKKIHFVFKNFPLDSTCNPGLPYQLHAHACKLARLAFCANAKGKFWPYHDQLFLRMTDEHLKEGFDAIAEKLSSIFSKEEIGTCLSNNKSLENTTEDIQLGNAWAIRGTPTLFINGKLVTIPVTVETLRKLIELEESIR